MISFKTLSYEENDEKLLFILKKLISLISENKINFYFNSGVAIAIAYYSNLEIMINENDISIVSGNKNKIILNQNFLEKYKNETKNLYQLIKNKITIDRENDIDEIIKRLA